MATKTSRPRTRAARSTNSPSAESAPPDLDLFARFCAENLTLEDKSPFELYPFQRRMLTDYFSGTTESLILVPKKNGKSSLLSALALFHLLSTPDAECVVAAASREQAEILFGQARGFIRRSVTLQGLMKPNRREIRSLFDSGRIRVLASDVETADGVIPTLALVDELHRHRSADLYGVFRDGLGPRDGRMITISTAGDDESSPLGLIRKAAYGLPLKREGAYRYARSPDGAYVMHEWALEATADREDMAVVKAANPAPWQTVEALKLRHDSPSMTSWQWARFACGVWEAGEDSAISPLDWSECAGDGIPDGVGIRVGLDLGWKWDTTAVVTHWSKDDGTFALGRPIIITPPRDGTSTKSEDIIDPIVALRDRYDVISVVLDPHAGGEQLAQTLEAEGFEVISHSQDPSPMALAAERFSAAVRERTISHPNDPELTAHVLAGAQKTVSGEKWRFVKPRKTKRYIDALIAAAMVHSVAVAVEEETPMFVEVFS